MPSNLTLEFTIELDYFDRQTARAAARESGRTSIRVSKSTLAALRVLAEQVRAIALGEKVSPAYSQWRTPAPPPDHLLAAIAGGAVRSRHQPVKRSTRKSHASARPKKKHASKRSAKGMRRSPAKRRKVRA